MEEKYKDYDPYIDREVKTIFESILLKFAVKFAQSEETRIESLPYSDFRSFVEEQCYNKGLKWENKFADIFCEYFYSKPSNLLNFIFDIYSGLVNMKLIYQGREIPEFDLVDEVGFLLVDTSFIVALLCITDSTHALASAVATQCAKRRIPLYYIDETKQEMWRLIRGSKLEMSGLVVEGNPQVTRSQFIRDFNKRKRQSWPDYFAEISNWEQLVRGMWNVNHIPYRNEPEESVYEFVKEWLPILDRLRSEERTFYKPLRDEKQIDHDAICLGTITAVRNAPDTKITLGPWFLTFDNLVFIISEFYIQTDKQKFRLAIQPRTWLNYLLTFSKMEFKDQDRNEVAEAVILFTARTPDPKISKEEYIRLVTYKLGLKEADIDLMHDIVLKSPLRAELERALDAGLGGDADRTIQKMISDEAFMEMVVTDRKQRKDFSRAIESYRDMEKKYIEEKAAREALERTSSRYIYINNNVITTVELRIQNQINSLISQLESQLPEGFNTYGLPEPPEGVTKIDGLKGWLTKLKDAIETSKNVSEDVKTIGEGVKSLLPYISYLISLIAQYS